MIQVKDISNEMLDNIRQRFESTIEVKQLRNRQQYFQRTGKLAEALEIAKTLDGLFTVALDGYVRKIEKESHTFDSKTSGVPRKDVDEMMEKMTVIFMACDIIESAAVDINDVLRRNKKDITITEFDDIRQISDLAKSKLKYLQKSGDLMKDLAWADKCDNMYEMMLSKAKSLIRKRKESNDWGENMKKYG